MNSQTRPNSHPSNSSLQIANFTFLVRGASPRGPFARQTAIVVWSNPVDSGVPQSSKKWSPPARTSEEDPGGPQHTFTPAISFVVNCESQAEIDTYWSCLSEGGRIDQCGWLRDKFGLSWQIVPTALGELLSGPDPERAQRVMQAMLGMRKLDIAGLRRAAEQ